MKQTSFNVDRIMLKLQQSLIKDLSPTAKQRDEMLKAAQSLRTWREFSPPGYGNAGMYTFKRLYQIQSFLKRYVGRCDLHSQEDLAKAAKADFVESQHTFGCAPVMRASFEVLSEARAIVHDILGEFDATEMHTLCKFGKRAASGLTLRRSYLDNRIQVRTGTWEQHLEFSTVLLHDERLWRLVNKGGRDVLIDHVKYNVVPKSFKACRGIAPDTVLGGFLSAGLGNLIRERFEKATGIRLTTAPDVHKVLARRGSSNGKVATIDMQKASDSFTIDHAELLLQTPWLNAIKVARTPNIQVSGKIHNLVSLMLMGSGHTFPLQTLLFYALARACCNLSSTRGPVKVFGDDIIIPSRAAKAFVRVMTDIGFTINVEKSFLEGPFRESCGGDYYDGCDVRPAMPQVNGGEPLGKRAYTSLLLKTANSLRVRWCSEEIPQTCMLLLRELNTVLSRVPFCPSQSIGEDMALRFDLGAGSVDMPDLKYENWSAAYYEVRALVPLTSTRKRTDIEPYLWDHLRTTFQGEDPMDRFVKGGSKRADSGCCGDVLYKRNVAEPQKGGRVKYAWRWIKVHSSGWSL